MSETVAALLFLAIGFPCGALFGVVAPIAERNRLALFFTDLFLALMSCAAYLFSAHAYYGGRVEFWSAAVFGASLFASYVGARCLMKPVLFFIGKLREERKKKREAQRGSESSSEA